jgi:hypothetical protein
MSDKPDMSIAIDDDSDKAPLLHCQGRATILLRNGGAQSATSKIKKASCGSCCYALANKAD